MSDIDNQLAIKVFGFTEEKQPKDARGEHGGELYLVPPGGIPRGFELPRVGRIDYGYFVTKYSKDTQSAFNLLESIRKHQFSAFISMGITGIQVQLRPTGKHGNFVSIGGSSLPELICKAVLECGIKL